MSNEKRRSSAPQFSSTYFANQGYRVVSVEAAKLGWDLVATRKEERLQLEVKGLSGQGSVVELTPNEYESMLKCRTTYRLCVVGEALSSRRRYMRRFSCLGDGNTWVDQDDNALVLEPRTGARVRWA